MRASRVLRVSSGGDRGPVATLQPEHPARLVRRGDLQRELAQDTGDLLDLLRVALSEHPPREINTVFQAHANASSEYRALHHKRYLMPSRSQYRPDVVVPEQPICGTLHVHQVLGMGPDAAEDAEDRLHEQ